MYSNIFVRAQRLIETSNYCKHQIRLSLKDRKVMILIFTIACQAIHFLHNL